MSKVDLLSNSFVILSICIMSISTIHNMLYGLIRVPEPHTPPHFDSVEIFYETWQVRLDGIESP